MLENPSCSPQNDYPSLRGAVLLPNRRRGNPTMSLRGVIFLSIRRRGNLGGSQGIAGVDYPRICHTDPDEACPVANTGIGRRGNLPLICHTSEGWYPDNVSGLQPFGRSGQASYTALLHGDGNDRVSEHRVPPTHHCEEPSCSPQNDYPSLRGAVLFSTGRRGNPTMSLRVPISSGRGNLRVAGW